jgi:hypothetical protein
MAQRVRYGLEPTRQVRPEEYVETKGLFHLCRTPEDVLVGTASKIDGDTGPDGQNFAQMNHGAAASYDNGGWKGKT